MLILRYQPTPDDAHLQSIPLGAQKLDTIEEDAVSLPDESAGGYGVLNTARLNEGNEVPSYGSVPLGAMGGAMTQIRSLKEMLETR